MAIVITEYDPNWKNQFEEIRNRIWPSISIHSLSVEHVGSTSVEGLAAKPIIDIDIIYEGTERLKPIIEALAVLGYEHRGNLGIEGREAFKCLSPSCLHNLYVCSNGSTALKNYLFLREQLRRHSADRERYSQLKLSLAQKFSDDIDSYVDGKTEFILEILSRYDFDQNALNAIEKANRK